MVIDQLSGQVEDALWMDTAVQQVTHPLFQHGGLADPPAARNRVDSRLIHREMRQDRVAVGDRQTAQLSELRIHGAKQFRIFRMKVVWGKAGINGGHNLDHKR